ncbi:MAG: SOS response-associated peptidase [Firmicutes bacterium]|nr:SOS response-associated peptidase [Bacillota bacterium]
MCFFYALSQTARSLKNRYQLKLDFEFELEPELSEAKYYASGFEFPKMPIITNQQPDQLQGYTWGLIPSWVKTHTDALEIRSRTLNARSDTVFVKPSFRNAIKERRCLVPTDGFYEWREFNGKKYPYFIFHKDQNVFSFAGIWEEWTHPSTGEILKTFSILTTDANPLMEQIHNTKKRMPVILPRAQEMNWIRTRLDREEIAALTKPLAESLLRAYPISKLINSRSSNRNVPAIQEEFDYPELEMIKGE